MDVIVEIFQHFWDLILTIPDLFESWAQSLTAWFIIKWTELKIAGIVYAWGVASAVMDQLNLSATINSLWSGLDSTLLGYLTYFRIPEAFTMIINARVTRYVIGIIGI